MNNVRDEIDLHHLSADESVYRLEKFLNDAFIAGFFRVKVIHGKGSGTLRQAVAEKLAGHPLVRSYRLAGYGEGDDGVTIAELVMK